MDNNSLFFSSSSSLLYNNNNVNHTLCSLYSFNEQKQQHLTYHERKAKWVEFFVSLVFFLLFLYSIPIARWELTYIVWLPVFFLFKQYRHTKDDVVFWPVLLNVVLIILAMFVDIAHQKQLSEVFSTNRNHHCSHKRNSPTINTTSSNSSSNTMTNGQRYVVRRRRRSKQKKDFNNLIFAFRLMILVKKQIKFLDVLQLL